MTIHDVEVATPGRRRLRRLHGGRPVRVVGRRERVRALSGPGRLASLRRADDAPDAAADRLPRRRSRGGRGAREAPGPLRREHGLPRASRRRDADPPGRARRRRPLLRRLQGADGRRRDRRPARGRCARHRERRAARAAGVDGVAAARDERRADDARIRHAARVERAAGLPRAPELGHRGLRPASRRRRRSCSRWSRTRGICQISNTDYTAYCVDAARTCSTRTSRS